MLDWCREHAGKWDHHGHTERAQMGERLRYFALFYFISEEDAERSIYQRRLSKGRLLGVYEKAQSLRASFRPAGG